MDLHFNNIPEWAKSENGSWVNNVTTTEQTEIENYLIDNKTSGKKILHIGIGNSSLFDKLGEQNEITGVTIHQSELNKAIEKGYEAYLVNKYGSMKEINSKYDIVIDSNPSSYACHIECFKRYINNVFNLLKSDGVYITHETGMGYFINDGFPINSEDVSLFLNLPLTIHKFGKIYLYSK